MDIDLSDYVAGGYFVVKYSDYGFSPSELMPERAISLSVCISERFQVYWGWRKMGRSPDKIELPIEKIEAFNQWNAEANADPDGIYDIADARYAINEFCPNDPDVLLVGVGLHHELLNDFLTYKPYPDEHPNYEVYESPTADQERSNLLKEHFVNKRMSLEKGGHPLGYEVISYLYGWSHSWLCSGLEKDMYELFGIHPNQYGLIDRYGDAKKVYEWIAEDKMQGTRSEPEPYHPWLIVQYPPS
jgi:hypothetical protein